MNKKLTQIDSHTKSLFLEFFKRFKKYLSIHNFLSSVTPLIIFACLFYKILV